MSRWFAINRQYYQLNQFTHFAPIKAYHGEKWHIHGYLNCGLSTDDDRPQVITQGWTTIGGYENYYSSRDQAARAIEEILTGEYDFQVKFDTVFVTNSHEDEEGNYGFQVLTHPN